MCKASAFRGQGPRHDSRRPRRSDPEQDAQGIDADGDAGFVRVPARAVTSLMTDSFVAAGLPAADAARCAHLMTQADLTGADGHGVLRLPQYVRRLKANGFNAHPNITVTRTAPATALVDGDNGMGHLVMTRAADEAIAMARDSRRVVGRRAPLQPRRAGRALCRNAGDARHDRALRRGRQCQPHGDLGRHGFVARHQSAGDRRAVRRGRAGARHGDLDRRLRHGKKIRAARRDHARRLVRQSSDRRGHHRSEPFARRHSAADGRIQGLRAGADARASRRRAQRRRIRPRRGRFQCRRHK